MKILDRYIAFRYIGNLVWSLLSAVVIFIVVNNVDNLDSFIDNHVPAHEVFRYYYLFIPYITYLTLPIATLLATLFTIGGLTQTNELTAMHASGIPFRRPLIILLIVATLCSAGGLYMGETLVPIANRQRLDIERYEVKRIPRETRANLGRLYFQLGGGKQLFIGRYASETGEAYDIQMVTADSGRISSRIDADKMVWRDGRWLLQGSIMKKFNGPMMTIDSHPPRELQFKGLQPEGFAQMQTAPEELNYFELKRFIERLSISGSDTRRWEVELLFKVSLPVAGVVIVLFGAPIAAVRRRGGTAVAFGLALFICFIYFGFIQVGKVMGYSGILPPLISAWIGNLFFGALGIFVTARSRR